MRVGADAPPAGTASQTAGGRAAARNPPYSNDRAPQPREPARRIDRTYSLTSSCAMRPRPAPRQAPPATHTAAAP
eukprot:4827384-Prymnesium_polylepis.1